MGGYYNLCLKTQSSDPNVFLFDVCLGVSAGYTWNDNNYRELKPSEVTVTQNLTSTTVEKQKSTALAGKNQEFNAGKFNINAVLNPSMFDEKFGMLLFLNWTLRDDGEHVPELGAGLFFPSAQDSETAQDSKTEESGSKLNILSKVDKAVMLQYDTRSERSDGSKIPNQVTLGFVGTYRF